MATASTGPASVSAVADDVVISTHRYGPSPEQFGVLTLPPGAGPHAIVVLVHGGFWRAQYELDLMQPLVDDLVEQGYAVWNLEYRRVGQSSAGHADTLADIGNGVDLLDTLATDHGLDLGRVAVVGHSAGGHLALWSGSRDGLESGDPGSTPVVEPRLVVGLAAVADLAGAAEAGLGNGATQDFLGGEPAERSDAYRVAQPDLATGWVVLVHGDADTIVPVDQSTRFDNVADVIVVPGEDHFSVIDPGSVSWARTLEVLSDL